MRLGVRLRHARAVDVGGLLDETVIGLVVVARVPDNAQIAFDDGRLRPLRDKRAADDQ
ncbi:hypothetical protein GCM10009579_60580 [Streptomyces javensis]|uniref:Uncharacterized protein n=1 Tax=Streptomyces javensis TaxID=114698 RepID=A0ABN1X6N6_9ACTN